VGLIPVMIGMWFNEKGGPTMKLVRILINLFVIAVAAYSFFKIHDGIVSVQNSQQASETSAVGVMAKKSGGGSGSAIINMDKSTAIAVSQSEVTSSQTIKTKKQRIAITFTIHLLISIASTSYLVVLLSSVIQSKRAARTT